MGEVADGFAVVFGVADGFTVVFLLLDGVCFFLVLVAGADAGQAGAGAAAGHLKFC